MGWEISVSKRIYHNLANELLFKIMNGAIPMGDRLPPISSLVQEAHTSQGTIRKALYILIERKIVSKTYRGYFVTSDKQIIFNACQQYVEQETARYQAALLKAGYDSEIRLKAQEGHFYAGREMAIMPYLQQQDEA